MAAKLGDALDGHLTPVFSSYTSYEAAQKDTQEPSRPTTANPFRRARSISQGVPWRRQQQPRPKSLVLTSETEGVFLEGLDNDVVQETTMAEAPSETTKMDNTLKGKLRRASLTLAKGLMRRDRRNSEPTDDQADLPLRPSTANSAWHKLRQATSFRHNRMASRANLETIYSPVESNFASLPVPGSGTAPPIIPRHTGAAAKASAALQNQYLAHAQQIPAASEGQVLSFSRVDFVSELPLELAVQILSHLDARNLCAATRVSKSWNEMVRDQHIWRQSFLRESAGTYATSEPVPAGRGYGVPPVRPGNDWRKIYKAKQELERRWQRGSGARPIYLSGHLDSIYCLQFDE
jgi:F-box and WD-40 domain protein 1/11